MSNSESKLIYEGRIKEIEKTLIQFLIESGRNKRTRMESHLLAYLLFHEKMTQDEIQTLSREFFEKNKRRGISKGKISMYLNSLEKYGILNVEKNNKNANVYSFSMRLDQLMDSTADVGLGMISGIADFFDEKLESLMKLPPDQRKLDPYPKIMVRTKELQQFWDNYQDVFSEMIPQATKKKVLTLYDDIEETTPDLTLEEIESEIVAAIINTPGLTFESEDYCKILAYLQTRERLTQKELRDLTGLSAGFVSQALNELIEEGLVEKIKIKGIRKSFYEIPSIAVSYLARFKQRLTNTTAWKERFEEIHSELEENKRELSQLNGYHIIKQRLEEFLNLMPDLTRFIGLIENQIKKYS